ncbi:MAG: FAD-dependent thymidylate synthase [Chlamydiota bacterium]
MTQNYEEFTESQIKILHQFVSSTTSNVFVLRNLPEVIKGALFSRYSRSTLGLRSLLLKEFIMNEDTSFQEIAGKYSYAEQNDQMLAIKKAQNFYDRILDGYGDDSIGELGGAHLAIENISMLAAKFVEDARIGGSPLEKSTRYIYFNQKIHGEYPFYQEPILMTSAYRELYCSTCNHLFDTYSQLIPELTEIIEQQFPKNHQISQAAYKASLRAKVLDCLRGLLPASALTNMGVFGNGRFFETLLQKMQTQNLAELGDLAKTAHEELSKVIPSFIRRADAEHKYYEKQAEFQEEMEKELQQLALNHHEEVGKCSRPGVRLIEYDPNALYRVAGALLFRYSSGSLDQLTAFAKDLDQEELLRVLDAAAIPRETRRHKSPRGLEHAEFTFEILADFGVYRDLHRHRLLTQERQLLTCHHGYFVPAEIVDTPLEKPYVQAMDQAKESYKIIAQELPEEAQYIVPMAYNVRWYFRVNLRALQWICELRSSPAGHPSYRYIAQEMARQVCAQEPHFERFFKFVDYEGHDLGRLGQEIRKQEKLEKRL